MMQSQNMKANVTYIDGKPYIENIIYAPLDEPTPAQRFSCQIFRMGQQARKDGKPCTSANGHFLDGWYSPDKKTPPCVSETQAEVFSL
jgi:hypothetical protein